MFTRTIRIVEAGMKPVYVFDGVPPDLKKQELAKRYSRREEATTNLETAQETGEAKDIEKYSKRTVRVTRQHNEDCRKLLRLMGIPVVEAPAEAEAECAALCKQGKVFAVASEDMDSLTFGAPVFVRHLMEPTARKIPVTEFDMAKVLEELALTMDQFIDLCILLGCDYCETVKGVGPQSALKLIREHGCLEKILEAVKDAKKYHVPEEWPYEEARRLFKEPTVTAPDELPEFKWQAPDEDGLKKFLVEENGFNLERISKSIEKLKAARGKSAQGRLELFFKPAPAPAGTEKRKATPTTQKGAAAKKGRPAANGKGKK